MEPSDIDGPKGGETPGEMLWRLLMGAEDVGADRFDDDYVLCLDGAYLDLDAIASAFKAAVLKGEV
jgi:hypothetical protein